MTQSPASITVDDRLQSEPPTGGERAATYFPVALPIRVWTRTLDILIGAVGLLFAAPLFGLVAILIKTESPGPVFFSQMRIGLHRKRFKMLKFRKMRDDLPVQGPSLTRRHDTRLTAVGAFLERTKLDELPQLVNVLKGDMSIVGPRPEVPKFVEVKPALWDEVLSVKPGIFGPNQLTNRNESELFPKDCKDLEAFYVQELLPPKLRVDAEYARNCSPWLYLSLLVRCLFASLFGSITLETLAGRRWQIVNTILLTAMGAAVMGLANLLTHALSNVHWATMTVLAAAAVKFVCVVGFKLPKSLATSMTADDFQRLCWCSASSSALLVCVLMFTDFRGIGRLLLLIDWAFFTTTLVIYKLLLYRCYVTFYLHRPRYLTIELTRACLIVAPCSMLVAMTLRRGPRIWLEGTPLLECLTIFIPAIVRPLILLLRPVRVMPSSALWLLKEWRRLLVGTVIGSCFIVWLTVLLNRRDMSRAEIGMDALLYLGFMTMLGLRYNARANLYQKKHITKADDVSKSRVLIVGEGLALSAYVSALAVIPEHQVEVVGVVTPHAWHRSNTVGDYGVLGELNDIPDIVRDYGVSRILVLQSTVNRLNMDELNWDDVIAPPIEQVEFMNSFVV